MKAGQQKKQSRKPERGNWAAILTALVVVAVLCGLLYFIYDRQANSDYEREDSRSLG